MMAATSRFALALACLAAPSLGFAPSLSARANAARSLPLLMATDGPKDGTTITSARKELSYDASAGRFFETNNDPGECIPDDEYCVIDKESGELIRLTMEEKERIFLDALQVRRSVWMPSGRDFNFEFVCLPLCLYIMSRPVPSPITTAEDNFSTTRNSTYSKKISRGTDRPSLT